MGEEQDYMSDEFLQSCVNSATDERPGLIKSRKEQREHDIMKNRGISNKEKDVKPSEATTLEEGLKKPIASDNKGFLMIQKMGFKPGTGLGKQSSGITDPVSLSPKHDRMGLGAESCLQMLSKQEESGTERMEELANVADFVANISKKHKEREVAGDLRRSRRICHQLDIQTDIEEPKEVWFWPEECVKTEGESADTDNLDISEKLEILTDYLRKNYFYCIWCGTQYADEKDLQDCPGPKRELH